MPSGERWVLQGFDEFVRDLGVAPERVKAAEKVFMTVSALTVMNWAKETARSEGSVMAKSAKDVRTGGLGIVKLGGSAYDMGAEYGSYRYKQFQTWRGNSDDGGYFFWPSIRRFRDEDMLNTWLQETWGAIAPIFSG